MSDLEIFGKISSVIGKWEYEESVFELLSVLTEIENKLLSLSGVEKNEKAQELAEVALFKYLNKFYNTSCKWSCLTPSKARKIVVLASKMKSINEIMDFAYQMPKDDLCWLDKTHERWVLLDKHIDYVSMGDPGDFRKKYKNFLQYVILGQAFVSTSIAEKSFFKRHMVAGVGAMYYFFFRKAARKQCKLSYANPNREVAIITWNLLDSWLCSKALRIILKSVEESRLIYVPRTAPHILAGVLKNGPTDFSFEELADYIPIRVISTSNIFNKKNQSMCCGLRDGKNNINIPNKLIFHIHGGGFISMTSASHEIYTRKWAHDIGVPIFSVDYKLAPKYPYPRPLDDVWQAYNWVVKYAHTIGVNPEKIIITGDSAGGNLAAALSYKILIEKIQKPYGIMLAYPAVRLDINHYSRSVHLALEDKLLPHTFLKICLNSYIQDPSLDPTKDIFISPYQADDEILKALPPVRMVFGEDDPLHDDCLNYLEKLVNAKVDAKAAIFSETSHGALNFTMPGGLKEFKKFYKHTVKFFKELFDITS